MIDGCFVLIHAYELEDGEEVVKMLGVFSSKQSGIEAIEKYKRMPGFSAYPEGFSLEFYPMDKMHWPEGFIRASEA